MNIVFAPQVEKFLGKLWKSDPQGAKALSAAISKLTDGAESPGSKQMKGYPAGCRRIEGGDYRAIYSQLDDKTIEVEFAAHRGNVYEKYKRRAK